MTKVRNMFDKILAENNLTEMDSRNKIQNPYVRKLQQRIDIAQDALGLCKQTLDLMDLDNLPNTREGKFIETINKIINDYIEYRNSPRY